MAFEDTFESILNELVYAQVERGAYPDPTPTVEAQISEKQLAITALKNETTPRPATKTEYLALLAQLEGERDALVTQNAQIIADNATARKAVDDAYAADLATAKALQANIDEANVLLTQTLTARLERAELALAELLETVSP